MTDTEIRGEGEGREAAVAVVVMAVVVVTVAASGLGMGSRRPSYWQGSARGWERPSTASRKLWVAFACPGHERCGRVAGIVVAASTQFVACDLLLMLLPCLVLINLCGISNFVLVGPSPRLPHIVCVVGGGF